MIGLVISKEEKYWFSEHNLFDTVFLNENSFIRCPPKMVKILNALVTKNREESRR